MTKTINTSVVRKVAQMARIPITSKDEQSLSKAFSETLEYVENLTSIDTRDVEPTSQVTGFENVWREDVANETETFTQEEALSNAPQTHQGYFVVDRIIDND